MTSDQLDLAFFPVVACIRFWRRNHPGGFDSGLACFHTTAPPPPPPSNAEAFGDMVHFVTYLIWKVIRPQGGNLDLAKVVILFLNRLVL